MTFGAKIGASVAHRDTFNRGGTNLAGLATPMCCIEIVLLAPLLSAGTPVVAVVCRKQVDAQSIIEASYIIVVVNHLAVAVKVE